MDAHAAPARCGRRATRRGRTGSLLAVCLAALAATMLGSCTPPPPGPIIDYPARQQHMLSLVLERPGLLEDELAMEHAREQAINTAAWHRARARQEVFATYQRHLHRLDLATFQRLIARQRYVQAGREREQDERWAKFLEPKPQPPASMTRRKIPPKERYDQFTRQTERAQHVLRSRKHEQAVRWQKYNKQASEEAQAALERQRERQRRWEVYSRQLEAAQQSQQPTQRERERQWAQYAAQVRAAAAAVKARKREREQNWAGYSRIAGAAGRTARQRQQERERRWANFSRQQAPARSGSSAPAGP